MRKKINIKINKKKIQCEKGRTIMDVARENGIYVPGLCSHPDFPVKGNCRICVVEISGWKKLTTSCSTSVEEGMEIFTESERVKKARNLNIEMIFAEHIEKCANCVWRFECPLLDLAKKYGVKIKRFRDRKKERKIYSFANAVEIDGTQCVDCRNCVDSCSILQNINYLEIKDKGYNQEVTPTKTKNKHCILCGQCAVHCPVSAAQEQTHWELVEEAISNKKKIVVAQFAPAIRVSIGEDFGLSYGKIMTEHVVAGLKAIGFDYVFDVNFAADITTIIEAKELLGRIKTGGVMPMFTSCCPAWINYVEFYHPELIPNITTARSPQIHGGGIVKTYWADKMGVSPKDIIVVSVMPCTAKKYESSRKELKVNDLFPVDYVITTREFSFMLKKNNIDLAKIKKEKADNPMGEYSGAAAIFGGSGGVMESALRSAQYFACGEKEKGICKVRLDFKDVRGLNSFKEARVNIAGNDLRVGVVNGIGNIEKVLENLETYHYIEVMSCPGGCIGGGGQPIPTNDEIRKKRIEALYRLDKSKKVRKSYENKMALEVINWVEKKGHKFEHGIMHTKYKQKSHY